MKNKSSSLVIACGALAKEIQIIKNSQDLGFDTICLNANLHNNPQNIPNKLEEVILNNKENYNSIFVAYGDCGTGGKLDKVINKYGLQRLPGAHCYQFFSESSFINIKDEDLGTFYLTDFLAKHFDRLIIKDLGIGKNPELKDIYFSNYTKLLYIIQNENKNFRNEAKKAAEFLNLEYSEIVSGYGQLESKIIKFHNSSVKRI